ncbi:MAG: Na/Pi cotransporter family protein [Bacilli bacterium]|nr:Na/Pi cotransporter family protein [Bacilli bacterium]
MDVFKEIIAPIIELLVGLSVFMVGMDMMSSGMKKAAGKGLKNLFRKIQDSRMAGFGIGAVVTAIIQSSSATSVMAIGFINAGIMTIFQGVCIMMGAYVGTSVTGLIVSLSTLGGGGSSFKLAAVLIGFAFIGLVMTFMKSPKVKNIGTLVCGLGILFFGLETMSGVFTSGTFLYDWFKNLFATINFPILLVLIGALFTAIVQSSSATSGIVIMLVASGALDIVSGFYLVLGATIGAVVITIIASMGGSTNSKRMAIACFIMRIITAIIGTAVVWIVDAATGGAWLGPWFTNAFAGETGLAVAIFNIGFNVIVMLAALPFAAPIAKMGEMLIKDKDSLKKAKSVQFIDDKMLEEPTIAKMQAKKEIMGMMNLAFENLKRGYDRVITQETTNDKTLVDTEEKIDNINEQLTPYLIKLSAKLEGDDSKRVGSWFHVINDVERIGDHANNFYEMSLNMVEAELAFSDTAKGEFKQMFDIIEEMCSIVPEIFDNKDQTQLHRLHELENMTDDLNRKLSDAHYERIKNQQCKVEASPFYTSFLSNLERVADHLVNVGYSIVDPTGHDSEEN